MGLRCERAWLPLICNQPVVEQCAYCGHHFCMSHGHYDKACCKSAACLNQYKRDRAIMDRRNWEEERLTIGAERNAMNFCAQPECVQEYYIACGHCEQLYCSQHIQHHNFSFVTYTRRGNTRVQGEILLCEVCQPYLKEYKRDRYE